MDRLLRESGVDYEKVNYFVEPIGEGKLRELLKKMRLAPRELLRKGEAAYRELDLADAEPRTTKSSARWSSTRS